MTALLDNSVTAMQSIQSAIPNGDPLLVGSTSFQSLQAVVTTALATIDANFVTANNNLNGAYNGIGFDPLGQMVIGGNAVNGSNILAVIADVISLTAATQDLAGISAISGYANRIAANMNNASY